MQQDPSTVLTVLALIRPCRKPLKRLEQPPAPLIPSLKRGVNKMHWFGHHSIRRLKTEMRPQKPGRKSVSNWLVAVNPLCDNLRNRTLL